MDFQYVSYYYKSRLNYIRRYYPNVLFFIIQINWAHLITRENTQNEVIKVGSTKPTHIWVIQG